MARIGVLTGGGDCPGLNAVIRAVVRKGVAFLIKSQNADGSWGTGLETRGTEVYSMIPGSPESCARRHWTRSSPWGRRQSACGS